MIGALHDPRLPERFWSKVSSQPSGCWEWTGCSSDGYGQFSHDGRMQGSHRVAYSELVGTIPAGLQIDHLCRNAICCNPDHLEPVTPAENTRRGRVSQVNIQRFASQTHCRHGHEYTPENTRRLPTGDRVCRTCQRQNSKARGERRRRLAGIQPRNFSQPRAAA